MVQRVVRRRRQPRRPIRVEEVDGTMIHVEAAVGQEKHERDRLEQQAADGDAGRNDEKCGGGERGLGEILGHQVTPDVARLVLPARPQRAIEPFVMDGVRPGEPPQHT
jgi:hypothetical protein